MILFYSWGWWDSLPYQCNNPWRLYRERKTYREECPFRLFISMPWNSL